MTSKFLFRAAAVGALALVGALTSAQAATLAADGSWTEFHVDSAQEPSGSVDWLASYDDNSLAHYTFTITVGNVGTLTVLDTGFSGDRFIVKNNGSALGQETSLGVDLGVAGVAIVDFDAALADLNYSRGIYTLQAGSYDISGHLSKSVLQDGSPMNSTTGGLQLTVSAVPEPTTLATLLAGLSLLTFALRRRESK